MSRKKWIKFHHLKKPRCWDFHSILKRIWPFYRSAEYALFTWLKSHLTAQMYIKNQYFTKALWLRVRLKFMAKYVAFGGASATCVVSVYRKHYEQKRRSSSSQPPLALELSLCNIEANLISSCSCLSAPLPARLPHRRLWSSWPQCHWP